MSRRSGPPSTAQGRSHASVSPMTCNGCRKSVSSTCFLLKCHCLFCEDCVFSHFADSNQCPACGAQPLTETDFQEYVVSDSTTTPDLLKTCFQNILSTRPNGNAIAIKDACVGILRQMDALQTTSRFIFKQMIRECNSSSKASQVVETLKQQIAEAKKRLATEKDLHERNLNELNAKLHNKEKANAELQKQIESLQGGGGVYNRNSIGPSHSNPQAPESRRGPPLQGIIAQKQQREFQARVQQQAILAGRPALGSRMGASSLGRSAKDTSLTRHSQSGSYPSTTPIQNHSQIQQGYNGGPVRAGGTSIQRQMEQSFTPIQNIAGRPFSGSSGGSGKRIRDVTSGYNFRSSVLGGSGHSATFGPGSGGHINKRRRPAPNTPNSAEGYGSHRSNPYR